MIILQLIILAIMAPIGALSAVLLLLVAVGTCIERWQQHRLYRDWARGRP